MIPLRDENPSYRFAFINLFIITLCIFIWIYEITLPPPQLYRFIYEYGLVPAYMFERPWTLITHLFIHGGWLHLIGNMLYLWVFGDNVEDRLGHVKYFIFFLLSGIGAALAQASVSFLVGNPHIPLIGASGAIAGVLGAYMRFFPNAKVYGLVPFLVIFYPVQWRASVFISFWFLFQVLNGLLFLPLAHLGGIAWFAHIAGFIIGYFLVIIF